MKLDILFEAIVLMIIARVLIVILHELGHAIPAIISSKKKVSIYIGSYGNEEESVNFKIGLLDIWLSYKFRSWMGLCVPSEKNIPVNQQILYVLLGPLSPAVISSLALYYISVNDVSDACLFFTLIFFFFSIFDLFRNLIPSSTPIKLFNGNTTYNDGYALRRLFKYKKFNTEFEEAICLYNNHEYQKSTVLFDFLIESNLKDENIYRIAVSANMQGNNFEKAKKLFDESEKEFKLTSDDYSNGGLIYSRLYLNEKSLEFYNKSLELNPNNIYTLNNKGFALTILDRYLESIPLFDKAIEMDELSAYPYNNRGLAKIKTGKLEEGLLDIQKSIKLDENNSYNYRNLGIYHFEIGEIDKARELFLKAKELDQDTYKIDELILSTEKSNIL